MERRTGRTIRLVDAAIQELFTKGSVIPKNHYYPGETAGGRLAGHRDMLTVILSRLDNEHPHVEYTIVNQKKPGFVEIRLVK